MMETDPDWAPSLHMGHTEIKHTDPARSARRTKWEQSKKGALQPAETFSGDAEEGALNFTQEDAVEQTECNVRLHKCAEINNLLKENRQSGCELCLMSDGFFGDDDEKVNYYTSLSNLGTFTALLHFLVPLVSGQEKILSPYQMLLLTFMCFRLDLLIQNLANRFYISPTTANSIFSETVTFLYANLKHSIVWPDRVTLRKSMPQQFVELFGNKIAVIIDCFEIITGKPSNLKVHVEMLSGITHNQTIKYLIGITLKGSVCFISKGWSGYRIDKHITQYSGLLDNLLPGDIVLDGRGFDKKNVVKLCAEVKLPALTHSSHQPLARDVEETREIAHHIPVEEAIKNVCQYKYKIV